MFSMNGSETGNRGGRALDRCIGDRRFDRTARVVLSESIKTGCRETPRVPANTSLAAPLPVASTPVTQPATSESTRAWRNGKVVARGFDIEAVSDYLEDPDTIVWVDLEAPTEASFAQLSDELGLHELAIEDAVDEHQRPKVDYYESHLFLSCHAVDIDRDAIALRAAEIDAFVGDRWILTVREGDGFGLDRLHARWDRVEELTRFGVSALVYALLDDVVDGYFDVIEVFDDYYDEVSETLFDDQPLTPLKQRTWFDMRRALVHFHRIVAPTREVMTSLMRRDHKFVSDDLYPYFQDVYDHTLRIADSTDSLRGLVATIVETDLSLRDFRQNQIVKKVGSWAAIFAVPAFITGWFGMNVPFPGSGRDQGVYLAGGLIVASTAGLVSWFRLRDWL